MANRRRIEQAERVIPTKLVTEILSWLPSISLLKFKRVCNSWRELISSPEFVRMHLNKSKESPNGVRVLSSSPSGIKIYNEATTPHVLAEGDVEILGSCDGVVCFYDTRRNEISLCNPSTGKSITTVFGEYRCRNNLCYWFGRHPVDHEYVFLIGTARHFLSQNFSVKIEVYNFKSSEFSPLYSPSISHKDGFRYEKCFPNMIGTLLHTSIHWTVRRGIEPHNMMERAYIIMAYNFQKNEIFEIPAPRPREEYVPFYIRGSGWMPICNPRDGKGVRGMNNERVWEEGILDNAWKHGQIRLQLSTHVTSRILSEWI